MHKKKLFFLFYTLIFTKHSHQFIYSTHLFDKIFILLQFFIILSLTGFLSQTQSKRTETHLPQNNSLSLSLSLSLSHTDPNHHHTNPYSSTRFLTHCKSQNRWRGSRIDECKQCLFMILPVDEFKICFSGIIPWAILQRMIKSSIGVFNEIDHGVCFQDYFNLVPPNQIVVVVELHNHHAHHVRQEQQWRINVMISSSGTCRTCSSRSWICRGHHWWLWYDEKKAILERKYLSSRFYRIVLLSA